MCIACLHAKTEPRTAMAEAGCEECLCRMLAATGAHLMSTKRYDNARRILFAPDRQEWADGMVRAWAKQQGVK